MPFRRVEPPPAGVECARGGVWAAVGVALRRAEVRVTLALPRCGLYGGSSDDGTHTLGAGGARPSCRMARLRPPGRVVGAPAGLGVVVGVVPRRREDDAEDERREAAGGVFLLRVLCLWCLWCLLLLLLVLLLLWRWRRLCAVVVALALAMALACLALAVRAATAERGAWAEAEASAAPAAGETP